MARFKSGLGVDQGLLLPPSLREWLPDDHLAWFIMDAVDALDIDALLDSYRMCGKGELAYDPRMMLRVLIFAYSTGTFSSRKIASQPTQQEYVRGQEAAVCGRRHQDHALRLPRTV